MFRCFNPFNTLENLVDLNYKKNIGKVREVWKEYEEKEYAMQAAIEETALILFKEDKDLCREFLTVYSATQAIEAVEMAKKMNKKLRTSLFGS
jgi:aspartate aminotransferase-like enzyme